MTNKLEDAVTVPKIYQTIISHLLYNKKFPTIPSFLADGDFGSYFNKKANIFNNFFA